MAYLDDLRTVPEQHEGLNDLCIYIKEHVGYKINNILELGTWIGGSFKIFREHFPEANIICVDLFDFRDGLQEREFNDLALNYKDYGKLKMNTNDAYKMFKEEFFDLIYVDANHEYEQVKSDIINYLPLVKNGGFISGHDYGNDISVFGNVDETEMKRILNNVVRAVHETVGEPHKTFIDGSWLWRKIVKK